MDEYKNRIHKALDDIHQSFLNWQHEKQDLENQIKDLQTKNSELKKLTMSVISELDDYIIEMKKIRKDYGSRNNSN